METPGSRCSEATRPQLNTSPLPGGSKNSVWAKKARRKALSDLTNESSPIFGLAPGLLADSPFTPEAARDGAELLLHQVPACHFNTVFVPSPSVYLNGPTPANTPVDADAVFPTEGPNHFQVITGAAALLLDKATISRSLRFDYGEPKLKEEGRV